MAEPTETITATPGAPEFEPVSIGTCVNCDTDIYSGEGVVVDTQGGRWHPECRTTERRKQAAAKKPARAAA